MEKTISQGYEWTEDPSRRTYRVYFKFLIILYGRLNTYGDKKDNIY